MGQKTKIMLKIVSELSKMHQEIHKKSLQFTLLENNLKVKKAREKLIAITLIISALLILFAIFYANTWYTVSIITINTYVIYLIYRIKKLIQIRYKINQKLKSLKS